MSYNVYNMLYYANLDTLRGSVSGYTASMATVRHRTAAFTALNQSRTSTLTFLINITRIWNEARIGVNPANGYRSRNPTRMKIKVSIPSQYYYSDSRGDQDSTLWNLDPPYCGRMETLRFGGSGFDPRSIFHALSVPANPKGPPDVKSSQE